MKVLALVIELVAGFCLVFGTYQIYSAAAWIVGGLLLALVAYSLESQD